MKKKSQPPSKKNLTAPADKSLSWFEERRADLSTTIQKMVEIESPSDNKQAVDRLSAFIAARFSALGGHAKFHKSAEFGDGASAAAEGAPAGSGRAAPTT